MSADAQDGSGEGATTSGTCRPQIDPRQVYVESHPLRQMPRRRLEVMSGGTRAERDTLTPDRLRTYLDSELRHWYALRDRFRREGKLPGEKIALASINALQAVRVEMVGKAYKHQ